MMLSFSEAGEQTGPKEAKEMGKKRKLGRIQSTEE